MSPIIPGAREVGDPAAEMAALAAERGSPHVALDETHRFAAGDGQEVVMHITVTTTVPWQAHARLGSMLAGFIRTAWEDGQQP